VLFTSGRFIDSQATIELSQKLKEQLIDVYAVPIGSDPDVESLENTVSSKSDDNIFMMSSTTALKPQLRALVNTICEGGECSFDLKILCNANQYACIHQPIS